MKKLMTISIAVVLLGASSCRKNRKCDCIDLDGDKSTSIIVNETRKGAENLCNAKSTSQEDCQLQ